MAFTVADGSVGRLNITQTVRQIESTPGYRPEYTTETTVDDVPTTIHGADKRSTTALMWIEPPERSVCIQLILLIYTFTISAADFGVLQTRDGLLVVTACPKPYVGWFSLS